MATEFGYINTMQGKLNLTRFFGGTSNGICVQLTPDNGEKYVLLSQRDCFQLHLALHKVFEPDTVEDEDRDIGVVND